MKFLVLAVTALAAAVKADIEWSKIKHNDLFFTSTNPPPFVPRIVGGSEVEKHQYPHQVALIMDSGSFCGGSIIREDVILTAAHCVESASSVQVIAGAHKVKEEEPTQQVVTSENIVVHEGWDRSKLINDIALVILPTKLRLDDTVKVISLHDGPCPDSSLDAKQATISGWGKVSDHGGISPVLRHVSASIMSNIWCNRYFLIIKNSHICFTGTGGKGGCNGDSGGPMVVTTSRGTVHVGIASFVGGLGCGAGTPTVYTRTTCFLDWINSKIN